MRVLPHALPLHGSKFAAKLKRLFFRALTIVSKPHCFSCAPTLERTRRLESGESKKKVNLSTVKASVSEGLELQNSNLRYLSLQEVPFLVLKLKITTTFFFIHPKVIIGTFSHIA